MTIILSLILGIAVALAAGALSGLRIGKEALGPQLAAYMGGLYGLVSGGAAVALTLILLQLV